MLSNIHIIILLLLSFLSNLPVAKKTISDKLYEDDRFGKLIRALQRTRLLHDINRLETATLFAPINEAFDNDLLVTRERMLYHFLFQEIKGEELRNGQLLTTRMEMDERLGQGKIGQKVKVEFEPNSTVVYVGNGEVIDTDIKADNGIIHAITEVLSTPIDLYTTLSNFDQLRVFSNYLRKRKLDDYLSYGNHITVFAPTDDAIKSQLSFHEREYLMGECGGGLDDLDIWTKHHLHYDKVLYSETFDSGVTNVTTVQGEPINVEKDEEGNMRVAGGSVTFKDILAENGVIHVITNAATPHALRFTTHKYLCGLKCTKFVAATIKYGLNRYIESSNASYTILAPRDDYFDESSIGYNALKYHILEGKYLLSDLKNEMLVKTELRTEDLRDHRQRATVTFAQKWNTDGDNTQRTELQFNGVSVISDPVEIGNDVIYILSKTLTPPQSIIRIFDGDKTFTSIKTYLLISNMIPRVRSAKGITMFAPSSEAFKQLGLINTYFLHQDAREDLKSVISYHLINETIYSEDIPESGSTYYTIDGDPIEVHKTNNDIFVNDTSKVSRKDVLTSTGVLHVLDKVIMPPTLRITSGKLLKGINAQTFLKIVKVANLSVLVQDPTEAYTILAPTEEAFKKVNVTKILADPDLANRWARLHIIPSKIPLEEGHEVPTLLSNDAKLIIRKSPLGYSIEVKGYWNFLDNAKLLGSGKTWNDGAVYEIDKVLSPEHVSGYIGGMFSEVVIGFALIGFIMMIVFYIWHFWNIWKRQGYEEIA